MDPKRVWANNETKIPVSIFVKRKIIFGRYQLGFWGSGRSGVPAKNILFQYGI